MTMVGAGAERVFEEQSGAHIMRPAVRLLLNCSQAPADRIRLENPQRAHRHSLSDATPDENVSVAQRDWGHNARIGEAGLTSPQ